MDVVCRKCGEPWDVHHLRHEVAWYVCHHAQAVERWSTNAWHHKRSSYSDQADRCDDNAPRLEIEPADNGQIPEVVEAAGQDGWYRFVVEGQGCPACYGRPERQRAVPLTAALADDLDAATEGEWMA